MNKGTRALWGDFGNCFCFSVTFMLVRHIEVHDFIDFCTTYLKVHSPASKHLASFSSVSSQVKETLYDKKSRRHQISTKTVDKNAEANQRDSSEATFSRPPQQLVHHRESHQLLQHPRQGNLRVLLQACLLAFHPLHQLRRISS